MDRKIKHLYPNLLLYGFEALTRWNSHKVMILLTRTIAGTRLSRFGDTLVS